MLVAIPELPERSGSPSDPTQPSSAEPKAPQQLTSPPPGASADHDDWRMQQDQPLVAAAAIQPPAPMIIVVLNPPPPSKLTHCQRREARFTCSKQRRRRIPKHRPTSISPAPLTKFALKCIARNYDLYPLSAACAAATPNNAPLQRQHSLRLSLARRSEQHAGHEAKDRLLTSAEQHLLRLCLPLATHSCKMMEMDDATLLQMTKTRLSNLRLQESNLQKLALKCIVRNYRFYAKNQIQEQNLECLPKPLRNKVLEVLSNHLLISEPCSTPGEMNLRVAIFKRLVNSRTLKVDLTGFMFCHKNRINLQKMLKKLLAVLVDNAPNLEELTIKECGERERLNTKEMSVKFSQLRMLKSLKMPSHFTFESFYDLGKVCRNLPNLQIIWASVGCMHRVPNLQYLESCFPSLIVHYIKEFNHRPRFKQLEFLLDEICCRNAKRLEIVGKTKSRIFLERSINANRVGITERTIYTGTPGQFRKVSIEMEERTREDTFVGKKYNRYYEEDWEHLTDCMVPVDEKKDSQEDSRFNCIRFVDGGYDFRRDLDFYQTSCWQNVKKISVENMTQSGYRPLEMSLIAERCPNLERLIIKAGDCTINPGLNLSSLRDLELETSFNDQLPLSHILLAAPNLERVRLRFYEEHLTVDPIVPTSMIVDGTILRNLQKLQIMLKGIDPDPTPTRKLNRSQGFAFSKKKSALPRRKPDEIWQQLDRTLAEDLEKNSLP
ncbi:Hypothetical predicted protein [Cloeon dipterum]|uniref:F-box domain-containing protein n=1 Tax=Cloeon dipterum TaxID=197152 RepID=A0A8S1DFM3_9INSE|nr:Hypothetical predicted protein [Cloeon dipterum]